MLLYHASGTAGIKTLEPRISNHGRALVYFSQKRENTLVYLSNAIERYCKSVSFEHKGPWQKWASYGFTKDGRLLLEEYYENALDETYKGVSGYSIQFDLMQAVFRKATYRMPAQAAAPCPLQAANSLKMRMPRLSRPKALALYAYAAMQSFQKAH